MSYKSAESGFNANKGFKWLLWPRDQKYRTRANFTRISSNGLENS